MKSLGLFNADIDYRPNDKSGLRAFVKSLIFRYIVVLLPLLMLLNEGVNAQLVGSPSSGQSAVQYCAPNAQYVVRYQYEVSFGVVPSGWFRMLFRLENQAGTVISSKNYFNNALLNEITIVQDINPPFNWLIQRNHIFTLPPDDDCEYTARIWFYEDPERDGTYTTVDLTQLQTLANWHTDDDGDGNIDITPPIFEVCEQEPLVDHYFQDASVFACTAATLPVLSKPNFYERHVQFVYNTSALAAQGIPNVTINVYGTPVQLTDATGAPMPNLWNVNPLDGSIVAPYSTASTYFEGPVISTGLNATGGSQQTFRISYPAGGTVVNDYFEVTLRNWNFCNPWNGSQTNPNAANARTDVARIVIVDAPPAPTVPDVNICVGGDRTLTVTSAPAVGQYHWYSDAALSNQVAVGVSTYLPPETAVGSYDYYVNDQGLTGLLCVGPATRVDLNIFPVVSNNSITADQTICYNTAAAVLDGSIPSGGDGNYTYLWQEGTSATGPWSSATPGPNNLEDYSPGSLIANTWYRRIVTSLTTCTSTSNVVRVQVTPNNTITLTSAASTTNQTVCINTPITQIRYTTTGATGATFSGLPTGVTGTWAAGVITINGSPSTTVGSPFSYTITLTGGCGTVTATGTIRVNPDNTITRTSAVGTDNQTLCVNTPITNITYATTGATGATFSGLPTGVSGSWVGNVVTITGTPSVTAGSPYSYTVTLTGGCGTVTATGTIRVNPLPVPTISGTASVCLTSTHAYTTEAGMTGYNWTVSAGGTIISGAGTNSISVTWNAVGSQTVRVTYTNANLCTGTSPNYTVLVGDPPTGANITGSTVCIGSSSTISVTILGGAPNYTILIPEYSATPIAGYVSGSNIDVGPLALGPHTYTLSSAQDACGINVPGLPKTATATVNPNNTINRTSAAGTDNQTVCVNTPITNITYGTTGATGATVTGLPTGVTGNWAGNVVTISGTPSVTAGSPYNYTITLTGGCGTITATGTIRVNPNNTITRTSAAGTDNQSVCVNTPITNITYSTTGATGATITGLPTGVTGNWAASVVTITGTPSVTVGSPYNYTITLTGGCGTVTATGTIGVVSSNTITRTSAAGTDNQTVCVNTPIANITYATTGATGATITGLPTGVTGSWAANVVTITGTPSVTAGSPYSYTITTTGGCGTATATGTIRVNPNNTINRTSAAGTDNQTVCINTPIINITYSTTGATGATITGLPTGVTGSWAANVVTITGTPSVTVGSPYSYTITLTGGCGAGTATGTIRVNPNNTISRTSAVGTDNQTVCVSTPIANITYATTGATGATITGLPTGVTGSWAANVVTITGTPSVTAGSPYNYTITLTGGCGAGTATGTIRVNPNNTINRTSAAGTDNQTVCINTPIINITYSTTGATGATITGLPTGVTGSWAANVITITGTPSVTVGSPYSYTITLTGGCGAGTATGTIRVNPNNTISRTSAVGTDNQTVCVSTPIANITYATTGATGATITGLPTGVTGNWAANVVTITGTPSVTAGSPYNYTITLTGGCGAGTATGTIRVNPNNTITRTSAAGTDNQSVCVNTPITNITYSTTSATGATITGLPTGVTGNWAANVVTISGTPSVTAGSPYNYTITLTGGCGTVTATGIIGVVSNNTIARTSAAGTDNQTVCVNTPITNITYATTGATGATITGLPTGVTGNWAANVVTITGTPSVTVGSPYNYTITLTGGCGTASATGTITVIQSNTVSAASSTPTLCVSTPLTAITHTTTGATGIGVAAGLPAGVLASWAANTVTISGTPTAAGTFNYSIPLTGGCGSVSATGTITVITANTVSAASSTPALCINTALTAITHTTTGATGIGAAVDLPAGVTAAWAANTITITGTPTVSGVFNYSIPLTGGCGTVNATGTITVVSLPATPAITGPTVICGTGAATYLYQIDNGSYFIAGNEYVWTVPAGATRVAGGGLTDNFILLSFSTANTYTIQVTENTIAPVACYGTPQPYTINVYNNPVPNAGSPETICQGDATMLGGTPNGIGPSASGGTGSYTYSWLPTYGLNNPAAEHPSANPAVTMTYQLMVTDVTSGCISTAPSSVLVTVNPAPTVIMPPLSQTKCTGDVAVFAATVSGNSYQWEISTDNGGTYTDVVDNATYDNVTSTALTVNNITLAMSGYMYRLRVIGLAPCAPVHTSAATLTVNNSPAITLQPLDATVCEAGFATFTSTASDAFTYQWYVSIDGGGTYNPVANGGNYFGATTTTLNVLNIPAGFNTYRYKMAATGLCNPVAESNAAILTVDTKAVITSQPAAVTQCEGTTATFSVAATGSGLTYQWLKNGIILPDGGDISGATSATLTILNIETADEANYSVAVTGTCSSVVSNAAPLIVNDNAVITVQPVNAIRCAGTTATFSVTASGTGLNYQWRKGGVDLADGGNISGVTTATLTINNVGIADVGSYDVFIDGLCSDVTSVAAVLTVDDDVTINTQPTDFTACEGLPATFSVVATGTNLTYRWRKDGVNLTDGGDISGATTATLTIATIATADEGLYDVVITGDCSSETSTAAQLSVNDNIVITGQPVNVTQCEGTSAVFTVVHSGTGPVTYQWRKDGTDLSNGGDISGATLATLTIDNIETADEGSYDVIVTGLCSAPTSNAATLGVDDDVVITVNPVAVTQCEGTTAMFSVTATGTGLTYQWRRDGVNLSNTPAISGVYTSILTINNIQTANEGTYDVVVSGTCVPATSSGALLAVDDKPVITLQPVSVVQCEGTTAVYSVTATGTGLTYQWRKGGVNLSNLGDITGANTATLNIANIETADEGSYDVIITGTCGTVTSSVVQLTVDYDVVITVQPVDVTQCEGTLASFTVSATGTGPLVYQWRKGGVDLTDGGNITGSATTNLRISNISTADEANYTVIVTGKCTGATSAVAVLNVDDKVVIAAQPVAVTQCEGTTATFSVTATGTDLIYQWRKGAVNLSNGGDISGATSATLTIDNIETADEGLYYAVITGKCSSEISSSVPLSVDDNAVIMAQPVNSTRCESTTATFSVTATGTGLSYQWRKGGANLSDVGNISGTTTSALTINNVATADEGSYDVVITGLCSNVTSTAALLAVDDNAVITTQPTAVTQCEGTTATFSVAATGTNLTYRWRKDGVPLSDAGDISGATTPTLTIATIATADEGLYDVVITGLCSAVTSNGVLLGVDDNVVITTQPVNVTTCEGEAAIFSVTVTGTGPITYQWRRNGVNLSDAGDISGSLTPTLTIANTEAADMGSFDVIITGLCSTVTSSAVTLAVSEKPEIITQPVSAIVCAGEDAVFTADAGITSNPVYQWYVNDNSGSGWNAAVGARYQGATTNTLTVVSALEIMSGYQYRLRVSGSCTPYVESNIVTLTVTRQAEITQHPVSITVCETDPVSFTVNAGLTTNPSYLWEITTDGGLTWGPIAGAIGATYTIASSATADNGHAFRVVVSSTCGSSVTSFPAFLTVNELPEIIDQPDDVIICEYAIADLIVDAGVTTGATYQWERSDDNGATWNPLNETATYFGVSTMNLKVNGTQRIMNGDQFRVVVTGICTPPVISDPAILTVNYAPEILTQPVSSSICENTNTAFSITAQGTAINYQWFVDTGGGAGFEAISNVGVYSGATSNTLTLTNVPRGYDNYRYRVEVTGTCLPIARSATVQLDVFIETIINTQPADSTICEFMTASFTALADGANLTYQWQAFISGTWTDLTNTGLYIGVQTPILMVFGPARTMDGTRYRVVVGSDCSPDLISDEAVLTVYTAPELSDHPDEFRGCPGGNATFSVVAAGDNLVYQWQVNTGSGFNAVTDNATYSGTDSPDLTISNLDLTMNGYLVRAVVSGTCLPAVTSSFAPLRVYMEPSILSEPDDAEVCNETGVIYYAQVFNTGAGETTVWQVNQGAGWNSLTDDVLYQGTQTPQLVIMSADTTMTGWHYRLEITGPCGLYHSRDALLTVNAPPRAYIANVDTLLVCGGIPTQLHGNPAGGSLIYDAHRWFGDVGPLSAYNIENPVFNTTMPGYYRLIYQVTDSKRCVGLDTLVVQVEKPVAMFTVDAPSGCQPLTVNFTNGSIGYASVLWDFGDTTAVSTDINPQHTYYNAGPALAYFTAELEVTSANGCVSTMTNGITVYPEILSDFTMSDDTICSGETVTFSLLPGAFRYYWNFGDGQSENGANVINHVFMNLNTTPVTYDVILTTESFFGCQSADTMQVVVYPTPVPAFIATPVSQTFPNATVSFTNSTNPGTWIWAWDFADGNNSTVESPVHTYAAPGEYAVSLTVSNDVCTETVTHNVSVLPTPPIASFDPIPSGCMPWNISINNTSLYATSYYWDFGDGYTSNALNPTYTYMQAGSYLVTLTVQGPGGNDSESQMVYVYQTPRAYFEVSPPKVYVNDEKVRMFNLTEGADSFVWEFGDGDTSHLRDPYHKYTTEGIYDITLHAYSANGCYDTYVLSPAVTVEPFGKLVFATVFKPNQDGPIDMDELPTSGDAVDQFFFPPIRETVLNYHMQIFNRWGTMIFETNDINKPWNGYYKGKLCAQGVYVWLVEGKYANGRPFKEAGDITLLH